MHKTLLVIDDEPGYQAMIQFEVSAQGFNVLVASGGPEALEILKRQSVDLVITDMKMPQMDGLDVLIAVRKAYPKMPFVLMTGHAMEERIQTALNMKASTCLRKPFSIDQLQEVLQAIL